MRPLFCKYPGPVHSCDELSPVGEQQDFKVASKFLLLLRSWRRVYYKHFEEEDVAAALQINSQPEKHSAEQNKYKRTENKLCLQPQLTELEKHTL